MKFTKGIIIGSMITAGIIMMYKNDDMTAKDIVKKGRRFVKKMGII